MLYKGIKVEEINPIVYIKDKASKDWKENEIYVADKMVAAGISNFGVENAIDDMVYIYLSFDCVKEPELLSNIYNTLKSIFEEVVINLLLDGHIEGIGNTVDITIEEYLLLLKNMQTVE